jgi:uncharacterized protein YecE (DUF72 family)
MNLHVKADLERFYFKQIHTLVKIGTASDRYAGWLGQVYSEDRYQGRVSRRTKVLGDRSLVEEVLPVDSVVEYFEHFPVLEIDFTFYRPLLDQSGKPTQNFQVLKKYCDNLREGNHLLLKVPQAIMAPKLRQGGGYRENPAYLNPAVFVNQFYNPATELLRSHLRGFIFEQEYLRQEDRASVNDMAGALDAFFQKVPKDSRYHLEVRTDLYLREPLFSVLEKHGVGQVLSHWTWMPLLRKQLLKAGGRFFNAGNQCVIRLLTPLRMRYEDSYLQAYPFYRLVEEMLQPEMILETVDIMWQVVNQGVMINVIINNRAGGNAPLVAQMIAKKSLQKIEPPPQRLLSLWET